MLCRIVDVDPRTYYDWRKRDLISRFSETKSLGEKEAAELAVVALLNKELRRPSDFDLVCGKLRGQLGERLITGQVTIVCHLADSAAELCHNDADVGKAVSHGREVRAIRADPEIRRVIAALEGRK
jgi:hypothetical protein